MWVHNLKTMVRETKQGNKWLRFARKIRKVCWENNESKIIANTPGIFMFLKMFPYVKTRFERFFSQRLSSTEGENREKTRAGGRPFPDSNTACTSFDKWSLISKESRKKFPYYALADCGTTGPHLTSPNCQVLTVLETGSLHLSTPSFLILPAYTLTL